MLISKKSKILLFSFVFILLFNAIGLHIKTRDIVGSNDLVNQKMEVTLEFLELKYSLKKLQEISVNIALIGDKMGLDELEYIKKEYIHTIKKMTRRALTDKEKKQVQNINKNFKKYYDSLVKMAQAGVSKAQSLQNQKKYLTLYNNAMDELSDELSQINFMRINKVNDIKNRIVQSKEMIAEAIELEDVEGIEKVEKKFIKKINNLQEELPNYKERLQAILNVYKSFFDTGLKMAEATIIVSLNDKKVKQEIKIVQNLSTQYEIDINKIAKEQIVELHNISEDNSESIFSMQLISQMATFCLSVGVLLLYFILKSIISSILRFQSGLLAFFKYLNKESSSAQLLDDKASDEIGLMSKVINKNIKQAENLIEQDAEFLEDVKRVVTSVKKGLLTQKIEKTTSNIALEELKIIFNEMLEEIKTNVATDINKVSLALNKFKELDFTHRIPDAVGKTSIGLNDLANTINKMLYDNKDIGITLQKNSRSLLNNVDTLNTVSVNTAASLEETAAALEIVTNGMNNNTESILEMASYSDELTVCANEGKNLANDTSVAMNEINEQVYEINDAISIIDQIAFQTNILSLNAAVEAATAGEAGKGFAVVAQEVRNLANRSAQAAKKIKDMVEKATLKATQGKNISNTMIEGYEKLDKNISKTSIIIKNVVASTKEQQAGIEQINEAISLLDQQTQSNAVVASEAKSIASETFEIAVRIVKESNAKNFKGKDELDS